MSYLRRNPIGDTEEKSKGSRNWKEIWLGKTGNTAGEIAKCVASSLRTIPYLHSAQGSRMSKSSCSEA